MTKQRKVWSSEMESQIAHEIVKHIKVPKEIKAGMKMNKLIENAQHVLPKDKHRTNINSSNPSGKRIVNLVLKIWVDAHTQPQPVVEEVKPTMEDMVRSIALEEIHKLDINHFMNNFMDAITHPVYGNVLKDALKELLSSDVVVTVQVKDNGKHKLPVIAVLGPNPDQQNELRKEFEGRVVFKFYECVKGKTATYSKSKMANVDYGFAMTKFISHAEFHSFKGSLGDRYVSHSGGVSSLKLLISQSIIDFKGAL